MSREVLRAILKGDIKKFDNFVQQGININELTEKERWNYLHRALISIAMPPSPDMIQHLITCGVDVNAVDIYGNNPLHYAVKLKDADIIRILLNANVDVNHVNEKGVTPLREALLTKPFDYSSIRLLLDNGADMDQKVEGGISVKAYAEAVANDDAILMDLFNSK